MHQIDTLDLDIKHPKHRTDQLSKSTDQKMDELMNRTAAISTDQKIDQQINKFINNSKFQSS